MSACRTAAKFVTCRRWSFIIRVRQSRVGFAAACTGVPRPA
jgi:hypothetical protein